MVSTPTTDISPGDYVPTADGRVVLHGLNWAAFQTLLALRGETAQPRMAYLDGAVELLMTSRGHENVKSKIGCLLESYCLDRDIPLTPYGNWLLDDESEEAGAEPDECYIFGPDPKSKALPDLVIEVQWTRGGLNKREIYRRLGIGEVWFWKRDVLGVYVLGAGGEYEERAGSTWVPDLDLALLCRFAVVDPLNEAVKQLRDALGQV